MIAAHVGKVGEDPKILRIPPDFIVVIHYVQLEEKGLKLHDTEANGLKEAAKSCVALSLEPCRYVYDGG